MTRGAPPTKRLIARTGGPISLALALLVLEGCATSSGKGRLPEWPLPPDPPRVRFVRGFASENDLAAGFARGAMRIFVPAASDAVVQQPTGLAFSPDERHLYIACASVGRVLRLDRTGGRLETFAKKDGNHAIAPFGVAVDAEGRVYVSDMAKGEIVVAGADGRFLRRFGKEQLQKPTGLAIDRRRQLLYVVAGATINSEHHRVEVFSLAGEHLRTIGTRGGDPGSFNFPANLAVAADGSVWVVDMLNFRVQVFDPDGGLLTFFGKPGSGQAGTFEKAKSIAFDAFGNVYVVESGKAYVQIFNPKQRPLMAFGGRAADPGYLTLPTAIAIDSKNAIFVADFGGGFVNEYQLINTKAEDSLNEGAPADGGPPRGQKAQDG